MKNLLNLSRPWIMIAAFVVAAGFPLLLDQNVYASQDVGSDERDKLHDLQHDDTQGNPHWAYKGMEGPEHWGEHNPGNIFCQAGRHQSPIDLHHTLHESRQEKLSFDYKPAPAQVINNGHTIQVHYDYVMPTAQSGGRFHLNGVPYGIRQFHFHEPSEHHVEHKAFAMEVHFVHQDPNGHLAVLAVLMELGEENPVLAEIWDKMPFNVGEDPQEVQVNAMHLLPPESTSFFLWRVTDHAAVYRGCELDCFREAGSDFSRPGGTVQGHYWGKRSPGSV